MSILPEKIFRPKKVLLKEKVDLIDFYAKVKVVLNDHKIFVSNQIFESQWDVCKKNNGNINLTNVNETKIFYAFDYSLRNGAKEKVVFMVDTKNRLNKRIQLMFIASEKVKYQYKKLSCQNSVFLDKQKNKEFEF